MHSWKVNTVNSSHPNLKKIKKKEPMTEYNE